MSQRSKFESQLDFRELAPNPEPPRLPEDIKSQLSPQTRAAFEHFEKQLEEYFKRDRTRSQ